MTVNSRLVRTFVASSPEAIDIPLQNGLRLQILPSLNNMPQARKHQSAAFCAAEGLLVVWDDDPKNLVGRAKAIESQVIDMVWHTANEGEGAQPYDEKGDIQLDSESGEAMLEQRPTNLMNTILVACTLIIVITLLGLAARSLAVEISVDKGFVRLAFLALVPVQIFFTLVWAIWQD